MVTAPAVFLDRDNTIIRDRGYLSDPDQVALIPGAAKAILRFSEVGYLVVVVSNQSGVARGLLTEENLQAVHARVEERLAAEGVKLDGAYYCPYLDGAEATVNAYRRASNLRKPQPGMLLKAARELGIDLTRSWMIGDSPTDVEAGRRAGCRTILLQGDGAAAAATACRPTHTAGSLMEAAKFVEGEMRRDREAEADSDQDQRDDRIVRLLGRIHDQLDRTQRQTRQQDFSVLRLFGALLQMSAIAAMLWGVVALLNEQHAPATARLTLACFCQLASIAVFVADRFR